MTRIDSEPCVVLHARPYRENSLLLTVFSHDHGRVSMVARSARGGKRGRTLQPFALLRAGWTGRGGLVTLTTFEVEKQHWYRGDALAAGFYVAELLMRLMPERESHPRLFAALRWVLEHLESDLEGALRRFEMILLEELGYALDFQHEAMDGRPLRAETSYQFDPDVGFTPTTAARSYSGAVLLAIGRGDFTDPGVRRSARRLLRRALAAHLGPTPLLSRRLLAGMRRRAPVSGDAPAALELPPPPVSQ